LRRDHGLSRVATRLKITHFRLIGRFTRAAECSASLLEKWCTLIQGRAATLNKIHVLSDAVGPKFAPRFLACFGYWVPLPICRRRNGWSRSWHAGRFIRSHRPRGIQGPATRGRDPTREYLEIDILPNLKEGARYIGSPDAGQDWQHDMTYREVPGVRERALRHPYPERRRQPPGGTEFSNMHLAYDALPFEIKTRLADMTATHNIKKFWEHVRRVHRSPRPPVTDEQRRLRPPVTHLVFLTHPITGRKVLYCNPGFAERINELPQRESDEMLEYLFVHQLQPQFRYTNAWTENDLLIWDHLGTLHRAIADYGPDEIRLIRRCQVMATRVFDPEFLRPAY
jgi:taurine dioxygenase